MQNDNFVWFNGKLVMLSQATINVLNHSLHYSGAVFEGERAYNGKVFKLKEHTDRLLYSAKNMHLDIPYTAEQIIEAHKILIEKNKISNAYVRPLIFRSSETLGLTNDTLTTNLIIIAVVSQKRPTAPFKLNVTKWRKPHPNALDPQVKSSGHYNMSIGIQLEAKANGFNDSLVLDWRGYIAETTTTNIFFVENDTLVTPIADAFLNGITRQTVIELATELGITVKEQHITLDDLHKYQECFLTGSAIEIKEVESIDLGEKQIIFQNNKITRQLIDKFQQSVHNL
jgi:branched-chain amino acid aminotransferase